MFLEILRDACIYLFHPYYVNLKFVMYCFIIHFSIIHVFHDCVRTIMFSVSMPIPMVLMNALLCLFYP